MALSSTVPLITACGEQIGTVVAQDCAAVAEVEVFDHLQHACTLPESNCTDAEWVCWSAIQGFAELAIRGPLQREESPLGWSTRSSRAYVSREPDGYDSSNSDRPPTEIGPVIADHVQSPAFIADQPISRRRNDDRTHLSRVRCPQDHPRLGRLLMHLAATPRGIIGLVTSSAISGRDPLVRRADVDDAPALVRLRAVMFDAMGIPAGGSDAAWRTAD